MVEIFSKQKKSEKKNGFIKTLFPTPDFLLMPGVGLDISEDSIKALEIYRKDGFHHLGFYGSLDVPEGAIKEGEIANPVKLEEVVRNLRQQGRFAFVHASLPEMRTYLFTTTAKGDAAAVRQSIEFQLEENVPLSVEEAVFDYEVYGSRRVQGSEERSVKVLVVSRSISESYSTFLRRSGLRPLSLVAETEAIARAVVPKNDTDAYLVVDFGRNRTVLAVVSDEVIHHTSTLEIGGNQLTESIAKGLNISFAEAEQLKIEYGLSGNSAETSQLLLERLAPLFSQIEHHIRYWHSQTDSRGIHAKRIKSLLLCGGSSLTKGLVEEFKTRFSSSVELANVWSNVRFRPNYVPEITFEESLSYATAVGLALDN